MERECDWCHEPIKGANEEVVINLFIENREVNQVQPVRIHGNHILDVLRAIEIAGNGRVKIVG